MNCRICATRISEPETSYHELGVCSVCAERIANLYNFAHAGAYLTWPNKVIPHRERRKRKISATKRLEVWRRDDFRCVRCGNDVDLTVDHIWPESLEGTADYKNLQTLCRSCNSRKGARTA